MIDHNFITENGWPRCDSEDCERLPIPGTNIIIPLRKGDADIILRAWCSWFNENVEPLSTGWPDEGGWTPTNSVRDSNHLSATAVDLNWDDHPLHAYTFDSQKIGRIRWGQQLFKNCIWWGADWETPHDEMHFQLNYPENDLRIIKLAKDLREGYLGIYVLNESDDMTPEQDRMLRDLHQAFCTPISSGARYKNEGEGPVWTRAQLISNDDALTYDTAVERQAIFGNEDCIKLVKRQADRGDEWAQTIYSRIPREYLTVDEIKKKVENDG